MESVNSQEPTTKYVSASSKWIDQHLGDLTLEQKVAQCLLVLPGVGPDGLPDRDTRDALERGVGTLHSVIDMPASHAARYHNSVLEITVDAGLPPALISGNLESGVGYSLGAAGTDFPYPRGIGMAEDPDLAYRVARQTAEEARSIGYHWTFSPCMDVISTANDPILGVRAYGVSAADTSILGTAQIRGYQDGGLLASAKHFPGHGDSHVDTHKGLPSVQRTGPDHETVHMRPFRASIEADVASIMVAHVTLPRQGIHEPASLSRVVNRQWLREDLGYTGVIISDSLRMNAVSNTYSPATASLLALKAGADVANAKCPAGEAAGIIDLIVRAVRDGELSEADIDAATTRLLFARVRVGLDAPQRADEAQAAKLDAPGPWTDPARALTVSLHRLAGNATVLARTRKFVVLGNTLLARRFEKAAHEVGLQTILDPRQPNAASITDAASLYPGSHIIPVFCPSTAMASEEKQEFRNATTAPGARERIAVALVNSSLPASAFADLGATVVSLPAVDTFGIVTDAAVRAALDVLS
ncbi:glycoside hydrolase family 3 protein [Arthrobacter sp. 4R501]|uniref:glycoside hydrolase family 3 protein n=1 Tax=Arthrobacter sp. 4R501 TaxID=2058886 RepID=UPI000CE3313B|nr:glycoside hydrolase family 3 N-terminal domain-containing protein [Arthrobacter sp. 4R501]